MRRIAIIFTLISSSVAGYSPATNVLWIHEPEVINPYNKIWEATCIVESGNNPKAYNPFEGAVGIAQIRPIRLEDYYQRTGIRYKPKDMFDVSKSKEVFMYYASQFHHHDPESISRSWNGGQKGPNINSTKKYWKQIKKYL